MSQLLLYRGYRLVIVGLEATMPEHSTRILCELDPEFDNNGLAKGRPVRFWPQKPDDPTGTGEPWPPVMLGDVLKNGNESMLVAGARYDGVRVDLSIVRNALAPHATNEEPLSIGKKLGIYFWGDVPRQP